MPSISATLQPHLHRLRLPWELGWPWCFRTVLQNGWTPGESYQEGSTKCAWVARCLKMFDEASSWVFSQLNIVKQVRHHYMFMSSALLTCGESHIVTCFLMRPQHPQDAASTVHQRAALPIPSTAWEKKLSWQNETELQQSSRFQTLSVYHLDSRRTNGYKWSELCSFCLEHGVLVRTCRRFAMRIIITYTKLTIDLHPEGVDGGGCNQ